MKTKNSNVSSFLAGKEVNPIIRLYFEVNQLKNLLRQGWLRVGIDEKKCESVAEHSFSMAVLALLIKDKYSPSLDTGKLLSMCLVHEFGEVTAGDITPFDGITVEDQSNLERKGIEKILESIPDKEKYLELWDEFETGSSAEAKLARQIDKLDMALQSKLYALQNDLDLDEFLGSALKRIETPELLAIIEEIREIKK